MSINEATPSYSDLTGDAYATVVDAVEAANQRSIDYAKAVWAIFARPYSSTAVDVVLGENAMRTSAFVSLTLDAMQTNNRIAADLAREGARVVANAQEAYVTALRGVAEISVSNLTFVRDAAARMQSRELAVPNFN